MADIKGIIIEIGGDTSKLQKAFRSAETAIKGTQQQLRDVNKALKLDPGNTDLIRDKQRLLAAQIKETKDKLDTLQQAQKEMDAQGVDKNSSAYQTLQTEIDLTKSKLKGLEDEQKQYGSVVRQTMLAASESFKEVGSKISSVGDKIKGFGTKVTAGVTTPLVAGAVKAVSAFGDVDKEFRLIQETMGTTKNSAEDFEGLWDQIGESAKKSVYTMQDATDATLNYARAGFTAKQATGMLTPAMSLAAGTATDLSVVTEGVGGAMKMFGLNTDDASSNAENAARIADVLAKAQAQANTTTTDLFEAMSTAGPVFATVGWSLEDLATATDLFGEANISGSEGATAMKTGLLRLASPAKDGAEQMKALGMATGQTYSIFNDDGSMKSFTEVLHNCGYAFAGLTDEERLSAASAIFGKNQAAKWLTLINSAPEQIDEFRAALDDCSGTADKMSNALMDGTGGSIEQLKSTFDVLMVTIGQQLAPAFQPLIDKAIALMNAFQSLDATQMQHILRIAAVVAAIGPLILIFGTVVSTIGHIVTGIGSLIGVLAMVTAPMVVVGAAVGVLVAAFKRLWQTNEGFRTAMTSIWTQIQTTFGTFVEGIRSRLSELGIDFTSMASAISAIWNGFCQLLGPVFEAALQFVSDVFTAWTSIITGLLDVFIGLFTGNWELMKEGLMTIWTAMQTFVINCWTNICNFLMNILNVILSFFGLDLAQLVTIVQMIFEQIRTTIAEKITLAKDKIKEAFEIVKTVVSEALSAAYSTVQQKFEAIRSAISEKMEAAKRIVKEGIDKLKSFFDFEWHLPALKLPHFSISGEFSLDPPSVPSFGVDWYDRGGIFSGPSVIGVGEKRPEFVGALDDLREIVREESGGGMNTQLLLQIIELLRQVAQAPRVQVNQTINAEETSYAEQQRQAARQFQQIARAI